MKLVIRAFIRSQIRIRILLVSKRSHNTDEKVDNKDEIVRIHAYNLGFFSCY